MFLVCLIFGLIVYFEWVFFKRMFLVILVSLISSRCRCLTGSWKKLVGLFDLGGSKESLAAVTNNMRKHPINVLKYLFRDFQVFGRQRISKASREYARRHTRGLRVYTLGSSAFCASPRAEEREGHQFFPAHGHGLSNWMRRGEDLGKLLVGDWGASNCLRILCNFVPNQLWLLN